jgi:carboxyvinyl-carboxyphosphonate phosphorylmutase
MDVNTSRQKFRALLAAATVVRPASIFDPVSARIAEELGFELGVLGGSMASLAILGAPDLTLITLSELAEQVRRITRAAALPLLVDADHGYGNALNVRRTVQELEGAGAAAMTIEDTELPRRFGDKRTALIPLEEGVGKMRAAISARRDGSMVIVARTSAGAITGMDDAISRCRAYAACGADALFLNGGLSERADLERFSAEVPVPILLSRLAEPLRDMDFLARHRVRVALQGHTTYPEAANAIYRVMKQQRESVISHQLPELTTKELVDRIVRKSTYQEWQDAYLDVV